MIGAPLRAGLVLAVVAGSPGCEPTPFDPCYALVIRADTIRTERGDSIALVGRLVHTPGACAATRDSAGRLP